MAKKAAETKASSKTVKSTVSVADLRAQSAAELTTTLANAKSELADARRSHAAGELVNPRVLGNYRKTIARVETLLREKSREEVEEKED